MSNNPQHYTTFIRTTPVKLWQAITNPKFTHQYWGGMNNVSDWKAGSSWQHEDTSKGNVVRVTGKVLESTPHSRLVLSWFSPNNEADVSKVTFEIRQVSDLVRLDVTHGEFKADSVMAGNVANGWPAVLSSMKTFLETGEPFDILSIIDKPCGSGQQAA